MRKGSLSTDTIKTAPERATAPDRAPPSGRRWPPGGTLTGGSGVTGTLATISRADGSKQVTYNGMPLYTFQQDAKPGDATGDGVNSFHVVTP